MKISYITSRFPAPSETFASLDVNALLELGVQMDVYCIRTRHKDFSSLMRQRHRDSGLRIEHLSLANSLRALVYMCLNPIKVLQILVWVLRLNRNAIHVLKSLVLLPSTFYIFQGLLKNRPDMVHLFWGHYPSMVGFLLARYVPDMRFTIFLGVYDLATGYAGSFDVARHAKAVFTHSHESVSALIESGVDPEKIRVLHRGTVVSRESISSVQGKILGNRPIRFLTASRLIREKGVDEVLQIFSGYSRRFPDSSLVIAGDGPCRTDLQRLAEKLGVAERVVFLGHVSQERLFECMRDSDCFILMTRCRTERLPNVLKEAMLRRNICITTPSDGIQELISHGVNGFVFETKEQVLGFLLGQDLPAPDVVVANAQATIVDGFNVREIMKGYLSVWSSV